jgi:choline-glycine betaine transporter
MGDDTRSGACGGGFKKFYITFSVVATTIFILSAVVNRLFLILQPYVPLFSNHYADRVEHAAVINRSLIFVLAFTLITTVTILICFSKKIFPRLKYVWRVIIILFVIAVLAVTGELFLNLSPGGTGIKTHNIVNAVFTAVLLVVVAGILLLNVKLSDRKYNKLLANYHKQKTELHEEKEKK